MTLLLLYGSIYDQFVSNSSGANYRIGDLVVSSWCGKWESWSNIFVLGMDQDGSKLIYDVWWILEKGWRVEP